MGSTPDEGLEALREAGALAALLPAVDGMVGFGDGEWRHKDLWKHTKQVVAQAPDRAAVRWAALLHDIGKVKTRSFADDGQVHFFGHAEVGARMFRKLHRRLPLFRDEPELERAVHFLILHHLRASQYKRSWTDSAVRRFAREMGRHMDDLFCLSRADITTKRPERRRRGLQQIDDLMSRVTALAAEDAKQPPLPKGLGNAIMKAFGLAPSRQIGDIMRALEARVATGDLPAQAAAAVYVDYVEHHRAEFDLD
ncbi:MAG: HDIG domain-containing protein [Deltaproteobacteria bacterium]|nr:HDIG domain-containing protein [Deltaproteobacteria bacterium]MBW2532590.1 HDIG domain-containing protein [Deltaproteobacteria bacterium]